MKIRHDFLAKDSKITTYIYIELEDEYEFSNEFFSKDNKESFVYKLKEYIKTFLNTTASDKAVLIINGVLVGTMSLGLFLGLYDKNISDDTCTSLYSESDISKENFSEGKEEQTLNILEKEKKDITLNIENKGVSENLDKNIDKNLSSISNISSNKNINQNIIKNDSVIKNNNDMQNNYVNKNENNTSNVNLEENKDIYIDTNNNVSEDVQNSNPNVNENTAVNENEIKNDVKQEEPEIFQGIIVKLNTNSTIIDIELEEYIIGVVSAEMPASFSSEALKAQAIAARTYTMNKVSKGKILVDSVADQVYKTQDELRKDWGASYDYYYNKVKDAVYSTKGLVMMYGGNYIDALYHAISNGKTELPLYIWNSSYPYLVSVDSSLDKNVKNYEVTKNFSYELISQKLGFEVNENTDIEILSLTEGLRVNQIKIGENVLTGVQVRTLLGLRSADFNIDKTEGGVNITTRGYGHGVGMSQYGANELAKIGYSYIQILNHYYTGISIVSI